MRRICCILISVMILLTASCGQNEKGERVTNVFRSEEVALPEDFSPNRIYGFRDGYALLETDNSSDRTRVVKVVSDNGAYSAVSDVTIDDYVRCAALLPDGDIIYVSQDSVCRRGEVNIIVNEADLTAFT